VQAAAEHTVRDRPAGECDNLTFEELELLIGRREQLLEFSYARSSGFRFFHRVSPEEVFGGGRRFPA
jgi:hypothetical protein